MKVAPPCFVADERDEAVFQKVAATCTRSEWPVAP